MTVWFSGVLDEPRRYNAEAVRDCATLGYLANVPTVDLTYGLGRFWQLWSPDTLVGCDLNPHRCTLGRPIDGRNTGFDPGSWQQVVVDGPYQYSGTATGDEMKGDYGVTGLSPNAVDELLAELLGEAYRICAPGGIVLFKSMNQTVSGRKRWQTRNMENAWEALGGTVVDQLAVNSRRMQPEGRRQKTVRADQSVLSVLRAPRRQRQRSTEATS